MPSFFPQPGLTFSNTTGIYGNATLVENPDLCTLDTCSLALANFRYVPTLGGNALFAILFALCFLGQIFLGIKHKTWGYMAAMFFGLLLELIGYIGRIRMHYKPFSNDDFLVYLIALTIAPAFLSAAIYLCLSRIIVVYGTHLSWFRPRTYTVIFCSCDFVSLLLQATGGGIAASTKDHDMLKAGKNTMLGGLGFQVFSLILFAIAAGWFAYRVRSNKDSWDHRYLTLVHSPLFNIFLVGLTIATITIFTRSVYRCIELSGGFGGRLFTSDEALFMVLDGVMIILAGICLTFLHPGISFQGSWRDINHHRWKTALTELGSGSTINRSITARSPTRPTRNSGLYNAYSRTPHYTPDDEYGPGGKF